jgi:hypothetical protein
VFGFLDYEWFCDGGCSGYVTNGEVLLMLLLLVVMFGFGCVSFNY